MESILSLRKSMPVSSSVASISIELLPEFGWSVGNNDERAFGPGTLFQGSFLF